MASEMAIRIGDLYMDPSYISFVGPVGTAATFSIKVAQTVWELKAVSGKAKDVLITAEKLQAQLRCAKELKRTRKVDDGIKIWIDRALDDCQEAIDQVAELVEPVRIDQEIRKRQERRAEALRTGKDINDIALGEGIDTSFSTKVEHWLRDSPKVAERLQRMNTLSQGMYTALGTLSNCKPMDDETPIIGGRSIRPTPEGPIPPLYHRPSQWQQHTKDVPIINVAEVPPSRSPSVHTFGNRSDSPNSAGSPRSFDAGSPGLRTQASWSTGLHNAWQSPPQSQYGERLSPPTSPPSQPNWSPPTAHQWPPPRPRSSSDTTAFSERESMHSTSSGARTGPDWMSGPDPDNPEYNTNLNLRPWFTTPMENMRSWTPSPSGASDRTARWSIPADPPFPHAPTGQRPPPLPPRPFLNHTPAPNQLFSQASYPDITFSPIFSSVDEQSRDQHLFRTFSGTPVSDGGPPRRSWIQYAPGTL